MTPPSPNDQSYVRGTFGCEREAPAFCHGKPDQLGDNSRKPAPSECFFKAAHDCGLIISFHEDDAIGMEADLGKCWGEEVLPRKAP
jgi:hypothetical protein